jgi:hypothetical protein
MDESLANSLYINETADLGCFTIPTWELAAIFGDLSYEKHINNPINVDRNHSM